ncbi:MAG: PKD domain-containing protein [Dehalococcoidia bacterium]
MNRSRLIMAVGIVLAVVGAVIAFDTLVTNHSPAIIMLSAEPLEVLARGSSNITCIATGQDGDKLSYNWSASDGTIKAQGAKATWTAPAKAGSFTVTVTVTDSRGGTVTDHVTITVRTSRPPIITSLMADSDWTLPSGSLRVTCVAEDYDHDELKYEWSTTGGNIFGEGAVAHWTATEEAGVYYITVVVRDNYGSSDTKTLPISVVTGQPPVIEMLEITKDRYGHCYLKPYSGGYYVGKEQKYDIKCTASHPEGLGLSYDWTCGAGEISGEGSMITWTAPNTSSKVTVTVVVSDIASNVAAKNINLWVVECSPCTFGC